MFFEKRVAALERYAAALAVACKAASQLYCAANILLAR